MRRLDFNLSQTQVCAWNCATQHGDTCRHALDMESNSDSRNFICNFCQLGASLWRVCFNGIICHDCITDLFVGVPVTPSHKKNSLCLSLVCIVIRVLAKPAECRMLKISRPATVQKTLPARFDKTEIRYI